MTILLENEPQFRWQTDIDSLLPVIRSQVEELNWVVSNLECWHLRKLVPEVSAWEKQVEHDHFYVVPGKTLYDTIVGNDLQVVWGVFCGLPGNIPALPTDEVPYADGNRELWTEPESFQLAAAEIEIVCFDSALTIVKFRDEKVGRQFLEVFPNGQIMQRPAAE